MVLVNGVLISKPLSSSADLDGFGYWRQQNPSITLTSTDLENATLDLVVENWGRGNFGNFYYQHKGLTLDNTVYLNDEELSSWTIYPLEFKKKWNNNLSGWNSVENDTLASGPGLYKGTLTIENDVNEPRDTYINMEGWTKGIVIVNGFVIGKYALIGPQQTLYLPFLQLGDNEIIIFEQFKPANEIKFSQNPVFYTT